MIRFLKPINNSFEKLSYIKTPQNHISLVFIVEWFVGRLEFMEKPVDPRFVYPSNNDVYLGEDAYKLLRLHCPFCGAAQDQGCLHRLAVLDDTYFCFLEPYFALFIRQYAGFHSEESLDLSSLVPNRLTSKYKGNEELVRAAASHLNTLLPNGSGVLVFLIRNRHRHDHRAVVFGNADTVTFLTERFSS